jgi:WhiB family transcriptional regulator, redox-sensing transcriptional regulator
MAELTGLPGPVANIWEWQHRAACLDAPAIIFFHPEGERGRARRDRDAIAITICERCPVIERCRQHALAVREPYGVWGGLTEEDREIIYRTTLDRSM